MPIPDPNGSRFRDMWLGQTTVPAGATSTTITYPGPGHDFFFLDLWGTWPHGGYQTARTGKTITVTWLVPAPDEGGDLRWKITI